LLAAQIIGTFDETVAGKLIEYKKSLVQSVEEKVQKLKSQLPNGFDK
jgi:phosphoribosylcarboxyaminoimidazole (NCAIR) mutase